MIPRNRLTQLAVVLGTCSVYPVGNYAATYYNDHQAEKRAKAQAEEERVAAKRAQLEGLGVLTIETADVDQQWNLSTCSYEPQTIKNIQAKTEAGQRVFVREPAHVVGHLSGSPRHEKIRLTVNYRGQRVAVLVKDGIQIDP